jgi:hypothetical protein
MDDFGRSCPDAGVYFQISTHSLPRSVGRFIKCVRTLVGGLGMYDNIVNPV